MAVNLSVVVPTRNEAANIETCLRAFQGFRDRVELIVVDNFSDDATAKLAQACGAKVLVQGPERCAQRNRGWREATAEFVMFVDADMIVKSETLEEILQLIAHGKDALFVREVRVGSGWRIRARNFERAFYDGTVIDGLRVIRRQLLEAVQGYDETLVACEDWDLDRRIFQLHPQIALTNGALLHNEARQNLRALLAKKAYYSASVDRYRAKWRNDAMVRRQFGLGYRFWGVFVEQGKWRRLLRHPVLALLMYFERVLVGATYLLHRQESS